MAIRIVEFLTAEDAEEAQRYAKFKVQRSNFVIFARNLYDLCG